jgi:hypothetical protein
MLTVSLVNNTKWVHRKKRMELYLRQGPNWTTHSFISNPYETHRNILYSHGRFAFAIWLAAKITVDLEFRNNETRITSLLVVTGRSN